MLTHARRPTLPLRSGLIPVALLLIVACSPAGAGPSPTGSSGGGIAATLSDYAIGVTANSAPGGSVTFMVTNNGAIAHEFLMIRTDRMAADMPVKDGMIDVAAMGGPMGSGGMDMPGMSPSPQMVHPAGTVGVIDEIAAGASEELTIDNLTPGHYAIVCDLAGHYQAGMHADFTVE
ncbi:MAG: sulfocyanin-like copper-binding protein [Chloroflexota bacterium]